MNQNENIANYTEIFLSLISKHSYYDYIRKKITSNNHYKETEIIIAKLMPSNSPKKFRKSLQTNENMDWILNS